MWRQWRCVDIVVDACVEAAASRLAAEPRPSVSTRWGLEPQPSRAQPFCQQSELCGSSMRQTLLIRMMHARAPSEALALFAVVGAVAAVQRRRASEHRSKVQAQQRSEVTHHVWDLAAQGWGADGNGRRKGEYEFLGIPKPMADASLAVVAGVSTADHERISKF